VDVLVVGSGNGALTAALCAYEFGLKNVLVIEKTGEFGGTTATSGGMVWIPCNRPAAEAGAADSFEQARAWLDQHTPPDTVPPEVLDTFVREAPKMLDFLHERTRARYHSLASMPGLTGHLREMFVRSLEPEPILRDAIGPEYQRLRDSHRMHCILDRIAMTASETLTLLVRLPGWRTLLARLLWNYATDIPWVLGHKRSRRLTAGAAGIARLRASMQDRGIPLWLNAPLRELTTNAPGRVIGAMIEHDGQRTRIRTERGVVLAAGGFESNQAMREEYLPQPTSYEWSATAGTNTGDAIRAALAIGAATRGMNGGYWCATFKAPDHPIPWLVRIEKSYAGSIVVNRRGARIANESQDTIAYQLELYKKHTDTDPQVPAWLIFDARFRRSYLVGPLYNARLRPDWALPKSYFESGFVTRAKTIDELAHKTGIDAAGLSQTVSGMNGYARTGIDLEFHRGDSDYDRGFGDPRVKPNPCLAPITEAPFYALRIEPGDFGTQGGLVTDVNAQVLRSTGEPIPGLYAVGNTAAPLCPSYPTGGCTLGPAMTFAWLAAQHLARSGFPQP
jgi:3-oxosteroid 1-dehydrogenase